MKTQNPKQALVIWYSQTGHIAIIGKIIEATWKKQGLNVESSDIRNFDYLLKYLPQAWFVKLLLRKHTIDSDKCVGCGTCVSKCPINAIDLNNYKIDKKPCLVCLGCVNNCPAQAIDMEFMGKKVYGFNEFLKQNNIIIETPEILKENKET